MSAMVCGKRSSSVFEEFIHTTPPQASKRTRCSPGSPSPSRGGSVRLSPARTSPHDDRNVGRGDRAPFVALLAHLKSLFPDRDQQLLERVLEVSGNDLDSAIMRLNDLPLDPVKFSLDSVASISETGTKANVQLSNEGVMDNIADVATMNPPATDGLPRNGSEWADLFVREMMNASDRDDAKNRCYRVLEVLEKSIVAHANNDAFKSFNKEKTRMKEQMEELFRDNTLLKRAIALQHDRQKEYEGRSQELEHLKQLASKYQEQIRTLEINNYALSMHLRLAQQSNATMGPFNPDVF